MTDNVVRPADWDKHVPTQIFYEEILELVRLKACSSGLSLATTVGVLQMIQMQLFSEAVDQVEAGG